LWYSRARVKQRSSSEFERSSSEFDGDPVSNTEGPRPSEQSSTPPNERVGVPGPKPTESNSRARPLSQGLRIAQPLPFSVDSDRIPVKIVDICPAPLSSGRSTGVRDPGVGALSVVTLVSNGTRVQVDQALAQGAQAKKGRARETEACRRRSKERQQPAAERITRSATGTEQHDHVRPTNGLPAVKAVARAHGLTSCFDSSATSSAGLRPRRQRGFVGNYI
jgi:hypothetical protein